MPERPLAEGERVLLLDNKGRRYLISLGKGQEFHSHLGSISHDDLIGAAEGITVKTSGGSQLVAFRPTYSDFVLKMPRGAQVVYPKDVALILMYADIGPGSFVIEAGSGSGSLTIALARAVGPTGRVISYEIREDHHTTALRNLDQWFGEIPANVEMRVGDIFEGIPEEGADRMVLDLPEPWRAIGPATGSLAPGGILCCYLPTVPQVAQTVETMRRGGFGWIQSLEALVRTWNIEGQSVRPDHRMVAHTGFIIVGRKLATPENSVR